jgi:hypothetical protein
MKNWQHWVRRWGPTVVGAAALWFLSTHVFSDENTGRVIVPLLKWLFPWMSRLTVARCHRAARKLAHITVYFIFSGIVFRSIRDGRKGWQRSWAQWAFLAGVAYAVVDEIHQAFVPSRTAAVRDVLLDTFGALAAQVFIWWRRRKLERE